MWSKRAVALMLWVLLWASGIQAAPAFEQVLPSDVILYLTVRDVRGLSDDLAGLWIHDLWQEPSVQAFLDPGLKRLREEIVKAQPEEETRVLPEEVWAVLQGQAAFVGLEEKDAEAWLLLLEVGNQGERALSLVDRALRQLSPDVQARYARTEESFAGARLYFVAPVNPEIDEPGFAYALYRDVLFAGSSVNVLRQAVTRLQQPPVKPLAATAGFRAVQQKLTSDADILLYFNTAKVFTPTPPTDDASPAGAQAIGTTEQLMDRSGLRDIVAVGAGLGFGSEGAVSRLFIHTRGEPKGLTRILLQEPGDLYPARFAPAEAVSFVSMRIDPLVVYDELAPLVGPFVPMIVGMAASMSGRGMGAPGARPGGPGGGMRPFGMAGAPMPMSPGGDAPPFNVRDDLLALFGPRLAFYQMPFGGAGRMPPLVVILELRDRAAFDAAFEKLAARFAPLAAVEPTEYQGYKTYVPGGPGTGLPVAFAVGRDRLILGTGPELVRGAIDRAGGAGASLANRPGHKALTARFPSSGLTMMSYSDPRPQLEAQFRALKSTDGQTLTAQLRQDPDIAALLDLFDFSHMPAPEIMARHAPPSVSWARVHPDGLLIQSVSPARSPEAAD